MKKIIIAFILIFSLSFFYGCKDRSTQLPNDYVAVQMEYHQDGQILQSFEIKTGFIDALSIPQQASFSQSVCNSLEEIRNRFFLAFAVKYLQNQTEQFKLGKGVKVSPISYQKENQIFGFEICFSSPSAWRFYNGLEYENSTNNLEGNGKIPFLEKRVQKSDFPLANKGQEAGTGQMLANVVLSALDCLENGQELRETFRPEFVYCYSTYVSKIKSNADIVSRKGGQYYHIWIEQTIDDCRQIEIYYYLYDRGLWLILGLTIPCAGLVLYLIMLKIKQKRKAD